MPVSISGTNGVTFPDSSLQAAAASPYVLKNRLINSDMRIDQRNAGASVSIPSTGGQYTLDRWKIISNQSSKMTVQQNAASVTPPTGFTNYLGVTSSSSYTVLTGDYFYLEQDIEGYNIADLAWGTANAKTITLSFQVRSSLTGTFGGAVSNSAQDRNYPFTYTISTANTWTQISVTIAGDTSGTWLTTNGVGIRVFFGLGVGTTYSGTAGAWASATYVTATGAVSVVGTNGATWYVTGVQLEIGSSATPFERRLYNQELANCQRYFQVLGKGINGSPPYQMFSVVTFESATSAFGTVALKVNMRTQSTVTYSGAFTTSYGTLGTLLNDTNQTGPDMAMVGWNSGSGGTIAYSAYLRATNSTATFISFSAEL